EQAQPPKRHRHDDALLLFRGVPLNEEAAKKGGIANPANDLPHVPFNAQKSSVAHEPVHEAGLSLRAAAVATEFREDFSCTVVTFNFQHLTSVFHGTERFHSFIRCWVLDVECSMFWAVASPRCGQNACHPSDLVNATDYLQQRNRPTPFPRAA